jgi:Holliday junction resolvase
MGEKERHDAIRKEVFKQLWDAGFRRLKCNHFHRNPNGGRNAIFDVVIFNQDDSLLAVIEVKRERKAQITKPRPLKQLQRYRSMVDCPVILVRGIEQAQNIMITLKYKLSVANP